MMLDMIPSDPLPAMTFAVFRRKRSARTSRDRARRWGRAGGQPWQHGWRPGTRGCSQGVFVGGEFDDAGEPCLALQLGNGFAGLVRLETFYVRRYQPHLRNEKTGGKTREDTKAGLEKQSWPLPLTIVPQLFTLFHAGLYDSRPSPYRPPPRVQLHGFEKSIFRFLPDIFPLVVRESQARATNSFRCMFF